MAYADTIRIANPTVSQVATLIDGMRVTYGRCVGTTLLSTASTSYVDMTAMSFSLTIPSGGIALIRCSIQFSHSASSYVAFQLVEDGVAIGVVDWSQYGSANSTAGSTNAIGFEELRVAATTGAHTYKVQWKVGSGTGYSLRQIFYGLVFQNS